MKINKEVQKLFDVNEKDYREWCNLTNHKHYSTESRRIFFDKLNRGRIVRNSVTGKLEERYGDT